MSTASDFNVRGVSGMVPSHATDGLDEHGKDAAEKRKKRKKKPGRGKSLIPEATLPEPQDDAQGSESGEDVGPIDFLV